MSENITDKLTNFLNLFKSSSINNNLTSLQINLNDNINSLDDLLGCITFIQVV